MTAFEIYRDLILLTLGLIGTGLSVYNLIEARGRGLRRVRVYTETAMHTFTNGEIGDPFLKVVASNLGHRDVTISNLGIEITGGQTLALLDQDTFYGDRDTPIPTRLSDGEMAHRYYPYSWISSALWNGGIKKRTKIKPFVVDTAGQRHYGKAMSWDPTQFRETH